MSADSDLRLALAAKSLKYVGIRGNPRGGVAFIGEAPGFDEDACGYPFVGASGRLADDLLALVGFVKGEVYFTNPYKSRPPDNDIKRIGELGIDLKLFKAQFFEELDHYRPTIIICAGKTPTNLLCPETIAKGKKNEDKEGFGSWRGSLLISPHLPWPHYVIPMYHPAFVLRNYSEKEICQFILAKAYEEFKHFRSHGVLNSLPIRNFLLNPSPGDALNFLSLCISSPGPISIDIELLSRKVPYTISFATSPTEAMSLCFWKYEMNYLVPLWRSMNEIFKTKWQIYQNGTSFDMHWLRVMGFEPNPRLIHDTLIRHHCLWPELKHSLQFQTMQYTREPYYKEEGKGWNIKEKLERLMKYNCKDSAVTYEIFLEQEKEFNERAS